MSTSPPAVRVLFAALALAAVLAGCGSSKPSATHATGPTTAAPETTTSASTGQPAARARHARAARPQAEPTAPTPRASAGKKKAQHATSPGRGAAKAKPKGKSNGITTAPATTTTTPKPTGAIVSVNETSIGGVLINVKGRTLYLFEKDPPRRSACSGACAAVWPPLITTGKPVAGQGANPSKLATITRASGAHQVTYNGHPLYLFAGDTRGGQTTGEGLSQFGGRWWAVSPAGEKITK